MTDDIRPWLNLVDAIVTSGIKTNDEEFLNSKWGETLQSILLEYASTHEHHTYAQNTYTKDIKRYY